jgi:hypothetical protein
MDALVLKAIARPGTSWRVGVLPAGLAAADDGKGGSGYGKSLSHAPSRLAGLLAGVKNKVTPAVLQVSGGAELAGLLGLVLVLGMARSRIQEALPRCALGWLVAAGIHEPAFASHPFLVSPPK